MSNFLWFKWTTLILAILMFTASAVQAKEATVKAAGVIPIYIPVDGEAHLTQISSLSDAVWYEFSVPQDSTVLIRLSGIPTDDMGVNYQLFPEINQSPATTPMDSLVVMETDMDRAVQLTAGNYYVKLTGSSNLWRNGWSSLGFYFSVAQLDFENGTSATAKLVKPDGSILSAKIPFEGAEAWYKVVVPNTDTLRIQLQDIPLSDMGVKMQVYKEIDGTIPSTTVSSMQTDYDPFLDLSVPVTAGTYYIKLTGFEFYIGWEQGWSDTPFHMMVSLLNSSTNSTPETAMILNTDGTSYSVKIASPSAEAWFKILNTEAASLRLELNQIPKADMGVKLELYRETNGTISNTPVASSEAIQAASLLDSMKVFQGTYYLKITGTKYYTYDPGWSEQSFTLQAKYLDPENNETYQTATEITPNGVQKAIMISAKDDTDWYKIAIHEPGALRFGVSAVSDDEMSLQMELYGEENGGIKSTPIQSVELGFNESAMERSVKVYPGTYYVKLTGIRDSSWVLGWSEQSFWLETEAFDFENNEAREQATPLRNETALNGYISYPGDVDWYEIDVPFQGLMRVESMQSYIVYREDPTGNLEEITGTSPIPIEQGKYYFKLGDEEDTSWSTTPYSINVSLMAYLYTEISHNQVELSWDPLWQADSYIVMRKEGEEEFTAIQTLDGDQRSFVDEGIIDYRNYHYMIKASGSLMNQSQTKLVVANDLENLLYTEQSKMTYSQKDWTDRIILGMGEEFRFDPSGPSVFYLRDHTIYRNEMNGSTEMKIVDGIDSIEEFDISPDGKILYALGNKLYQANGSGVGQSELPTNQAEEITEARWLIDSGERMGYLYHAGGEQVLKYFGDDRFFPFDPELSFSPNGLLTLKPDISGANDGTSEYEKTELYLIGSESRKIKEWEKEDNGFLGHYTDLVSVVWNPDGSRFALQTDEISYSMSVLTGQRSYTTTTNVELFDQTGTKLMTLFTDTNASNGSGNYLRGAGDKLVLEKDDQVLVRDFSTAYGWVELTPPSNDIGGIVPVGAFEAKPPFLPDLNGDGVVDLFDVVQVSKKQFLDLEKVISSYGRVQ